MGVAGEYRHPHRALEKFNVKVSAKRENGKMGFWKPNPFLVIGDAATGGQGKCLPASFQMRCASRATSGTRSPWWWSHFPRALSGRRLPEWRYWWASFSVGCGISAYSSLSGSTCCLSISAFNVLCFKNWRRCGRSKSSRRMTCLGWNRAAFIDSRQRKFLSDSHCHALPHS